MSPWHADLRGDSILALSFAGVGGQGIVLAGVILGEAAVQAGLWACQSAAYTVAARGGFSRSEVLISRRPLSCPLAERLDVVLALAELGWLGERRRLAPDGIGLVEPGWSGGAGGENEPRVLTVPFAEIAAGAGAPRSANVAAVGVLSGLCAAVPLEAVALAVGRRLGTAGPAVAALRAGLEAGEKLRSYLEGSR